MSSIIDWSQGPWQTAAVIKGLAQRINDQIKDRLRVPPSDFEYRKVPVPPNQKSAGPLYDFITSIRRTDLARPNLFEVIITAPIQGDMKDISLLCKSTSFPMTMLRTVENRDFGMPFQIPTQMQHEDVMMTFYVDSGMQIKMFFDRWIDCAYNSKTNEIGFYDDYKSLITIKQLDQAFETTYSVELIECYPKVVSSIQVDNQSTGAVEELQVTFAFRSFREQSVSRRTPQQGDVRRYEIMKQMSGSSSTSYDNMIDAAAKFEGYRNVTDLNAIKRMVDSDVNNPTSVTQFMDKFKNPEDSGAVKVKDFTNLLA